MRTGLSFSPVAQAELAKEQVHASSKTKVHQLAACFGRIRIVFECWKMSESCTMAGSKIMTLLSG